ncbi:MAG: M23 family metallopeptidase, partial [Candidatus Aenigmarchaeota archaeon]|nr:M23 family metallopeptidase [Candidatus Aenigmarchaeota archaeon]
EGIKPLEDPNIEIIKTPITCAPSMEFINYFLNRTFSSYKYIDRGGRVNGIDIFVGDNKPHVETIIDPSTGASIQKTHWGYDESTKDENNDIIADFSPYDNKIRINITHKISLKSVTSGIQTDLNNSVLIGTRFYDMAEKSKEAVGFLLSFHDKSTDKGERTISVPDPSNPAQNIDKLVFRDETVDKELVYKPYDPSSGSDTEESYLQRIESKMSSGLAGIGGDFEIEMRRNDLELIAPLDAAGSDPDDTSFFAGGRTWNGLVLHYDIDVIVSEKVKKRKVLSVSPVSGFVWLWPTKRADGNEGSRRLTSCFNERRGDESRVRWHKGLDIGGKIRGESGDNDIIIASGRGGETISLFKWCQEGAIGCGSGYGNYVILKHEGMDGTNPYIYYSLYAHMNSLSLSLLSNPSSVSPGTMEIGVMGNTGRSTGKHLHFEVRDDKGNKLNPCDFIDCGGTKCPVPSPGSMIEIEEPEEGYYYYDEDENNFEKMPMQIRFKAEDYMSALDCSSADVDSNTPTQYRWDSQGEMICIETKLYTCGNANNIDGLTNDPSNDQTINPNDRIKIRDVGQITEPDPSNPSGPRITRTLREYATCNADGTFKIETVKE